MTSVKKRKIACQIFGRMLPSMENGEMHRSVYLGGPYFSTILGK